MTYTERRYCRICAEELPPPFFDLGDQPLANNLAATAEESLALPRFPLALTRCPNCALVQLTGVVDPHLLFDDYLYLTGTSRALHEHFQGLADLVTESYAEPGDLIVDIGSNDSTLLSKYPYVFRLMGVEPANNVARYAGNYHPGIQVLNTWWSRDLAQQMQGEIGQAKVITACNVFAHCDDLHEFMQAAAILLAPDGTLIVEVPRLDAMLTDGTFDLIYHEHLSYFDLPPLQWLASLSDMKLTGVEKIDTHGGSFRLFFNHRYFTPKPSPRPSIQPINSHLLTPPGYTAADLDRFTRQAERTRDALRWSLRMAKGSFQPLARKVVGYTAPAKATVMANYAGLMAKNIAYIADDNPLKVGKYLPGTDIPIVASSTIDETHPDAVVVFAWNIAESLLPRLAGKTRAAIIPMPSVVEVYLGSKEEAPGEEGEAEDHPGEGQAAPHTDPAR